MEIFSFHKILSPAAGGKYRSFRDRQGGRYLFLMNKDESYSSIEKIVIGGVRSRMNNILTNTRMTALGGGVTWAGADRINAQKRAKLEAAKRLLDSLQEMGY